MIPVSGAWLASGSPPTRAFFWVRRVLTLYEGTPPRFTFKTKEQLEAAAKKKKAEQDDEDSDEDDSDEEEDEELDGEELEAALAKAMSKVNPKSTMMTFAPSRPFKGTVKGKQEKSAQHAVPQPLNGNTFGAGGMKQNGFTTPNGHPYGIPSPVSPVPWNGSQFGMFPGMQMPGAPPMQHFPGFNTVMPSFPGASDVLSSIPPGFGLTTTLQGYPMLVPLSNLAPPNGRQQGRYQGENSSDSGRSTNGSRPTTNGGGHPAAYSNRRNSQHGSKSGVNQGNGSNYRGQNPNPSKRGQDPTAQQPQRKKSTDFRRPQRVNTTPVTGKEAHTANVQVKNIKPRDDAKSKRIRQIRKAPSWRRDDSKDPDAKPKVSPTTRDMMTDPEDDSNSDESDSE